MTKLQVSLQMYNHALLKWALYCLIFNVNVDATSYLMEKISGNIYAHSYGNSVGVSNDYCVIGAERDTSRGYSNGGAAYIYKYDRVQNEWNHTQILYPTDITTSARCGNAVSIFENSVIIGCFGIRKAYIYKLNETTDTWYQLSTFTAMDGSESIRFAYDVDITDGYAIVEDSWNDDQGYGAGSSNILVQTFDEYGQESWIHNQTLYATDAGSGDYFGESVSISYDYAIVGARTDDDNGYDSGSAYIFELNGNTLEWEQITKLLASNGASYDYFGVSVSIDGIYGLAIVGACYYLSDDDIGASYVYERNNDSGVWSETTILSPNDETLGQNFGISVSIYGK